MQALASFASIPFQDQILMFQGARLDPSRTLAAYRLPVEGVDDVEEHPVFLYSKAYLKPGGQPPAQEPLPAITVTGNDASQGRAGEAVEQPELNSLS